MGIQHCKNFFIIILRNTSNLKNIFKISQLFNKILNHLYYSLKIHFLDNSSQKNTLKNIFFLKIIL